MCSRAHTRVHIFCNFTQFLLQTLTASYELLLNSFFFALHLLCAIIGRRSHIVIPLGFHWINCSQLRFSFLHRSMLQFSNKMLRACWWLFMTLLCVQFRCECPQKYRRWLDNKNEVKHWTARRTREMHGIWSVGIRWLRTRSFARLLLCKFQTQNRHEFVAESQFNWWNNLIALSSTISTRRLRRSPGNYILSSSLHFLFMTVFFLWI